MADLTPDNPSFTESRNYLSRLWAGDIPLVVTYWVWGGLVGTLLGGIATLIEVNYSAALNLPYGVAVIRGFYVFVLAYSAFIWVAIWRSAGKHDDRHWGALARIAVIAGVGITAWSFAQGLATKPDDALREEVRMMNASLPTMLDDDTRLDSVRLRDGALTSYHTIVSGLASDFDLHRFHDAIRGSIVASLCADAAALEFLGNGNAYAYVYADKEGQPITDVTVVSGDCEP